MLKNTKDLVDIEKIITNKLLYDHSTEKNIVWATDMYKDFGLGLTKNNQMTVEDIMYLYNQGIFVPRNLKSKEKQNERTRKNAEVFTPSWVINKMNNFCDEQWFGTKNVFNVENNDNTWTTINEIISFNGEKKWKDYIDSRRIEITCGEAPYIVSRYDVTTGEVLKINNRIGILDRKLRIVNENTKDKINWLKWAYRAYESVYGYEYQGDNLLLARINLLQSFIDYYYYRFNEMPEKRSIDRIIEIITWNFWQMDGLKDSCPTEKSVEKFEQLSLDYFFENNTEENKNEIIYCKIKDWRSKTIIQYKNIKKEDD
jgi:hypothetical protein